MDYRDALHYLYGFVDWERGIGFGANAPARFTLERITALLDLLDNPHHRFSSVHVAGSKGKGSTSAIIESILRAAGLRTGLYTQPHLHTFRERICVDNAPVAAATFVDLVGRVSAAADAVGAARPELGRPTTYELATAMGFLCFADAAVDMAVIEVGLGGRLDATNVLTPCVAVITSIGLEHTAILGDTLAAIAGEKAGIVKKGGVLVHAPNPAEVLAVLREVCAARDARMVAAVPERYFANVEGANGGAMTGAEGAVHSGPFEGQEGCGSKSSPQMAEIEKVGAMRGGEGGVRPSDAIRPERDRKTIRPERDQKTVRPEPVEGPSGSGSTSAPRTGDEGRGRAKPVSGGNSSPLTSVRPEPVEGPSGSGSTVTSRTEPESSGGQGTGLGHPNPAPSTPAGDNPLPETEYPAQVCTVAVLGETRTVRFPLRGRHQRLNLSVALAAADELAAQGVPLTAQAVCQGVAATRWSGRFEQVSAWPPVIADGAHTPESMAYLRETLAEHSPGHGVVGVFGTSKDKNLGQLLDELLPAVRLLVLTRSRHPRSCDPAELARAVEGRVPVYETPSVAQAVAYGLRAMCADDVLCATGSLFIAAETREAFGLAEEQDPPIFN